MRCRSEFRQLEIGMSTSRYLPASGTAGLERSFVSGKRRVPAPPPMMIASVLSVIEGQLESCIWGRGRGPHGQPDRGGGGKAIVLSATAVPGSWFLVLRFPNPYR